MAMNTGFENVDHYQIKIARAQLVSNIFNGGCAYLEMRFLACCEVQTAVTGYEPDKADFNLARQEAYSGVDRFGCCLAFVARFLEKIMIDRTVGQRARVPVCKWR